MRDPGTQRTKYTVDAAEGWKDIGVIQCHQCHRPTSCSRPVCHLLQQAMGVLGLEDKLLDVHYYEAVETMLTATYKKYDKDYETDRSIEDLSLAKALHKSFKAVESGRIDRSG